MGVHSGRYATVNGISTLRNWSINDAQNLAKAVASNTAFGTESGRGVEDWTGSVQVYGRQPTKMPGDTFAFVGYEAPNNDATGTGMRYSGTAIITQLVANWNWSSAEFLNYQMDFGGHLALVGADGPFPPDLSTPVFQSPSGLKPLYSVDFGSNYVEWTDVATATWTLTNSVQTYVNSSSYVADVPGPGGRVWTGRKPGNIDWTLAITEHNGDRTRFKKGDQLAIKMPVGPTAAPTYWVLKYGRVKDFTNIVLDREGAKIIQQTVNLDMSGVREDTGALGQILMPDGSTYWPIPQS